MEDKKKSCQVQVSTAKNEQMQNFIKMLKNKRFL